MRRHRAGYDAEYYARNKERIRDKQNDASRQRSGAYWSWRSMWRRCTEPGNNRYHYYGGRGVTVCERWRSFESFLADMGERPEGHTLDRIDTDGNYEPGNCRWATPKEQAANRRPRGRAA